jgi:hypothetical protein
LIGFSVELVSNVGAGKVTRSFGVVVLVVVSLLMPVAIVAWVVLRAACERSQRVIRVADDPRRRCVELRHAPAAVFAQRPARCGGLRASSDAHKRSGRGRRRRTVGRPVPASHDG